MTRAKISEYSATANDNTDVNGINIAEGCPPSSMNNMGREIMAALKRFQVGSDGDGVTVGGSLVVSGSTTIANTATLGNVDINGGAIDGTTIGGASAAAVTATTMSATVVQSDTISEKTSATGVTIDGVLLKDSGVVTGAGTVSAPVYSTTGDLNTGIYFPADDNIGFATGGTIRGRWTTDGLCFGSDTAAANALDDYEEGTFTYTLPCSTSGSYTVRSSYTTGYYTKIGRVVSIALRFESQGSSSPVGDLQLAGLPFTTAGSPSGGNANFDLPILFRGSTGTIASFYFSLPLSSTTGTFRKQLTDGTFSSVSVSDISGGSGGNFEGSLLFTYVAS